MYCSEVYLTGLEHDKSAAKFDLEIDTMALEDEYADCQ